MTRLFTLLLLGRVLLAAPSAKAPRNPDVPPQITLPSAGSEVVHGTTASAAREIRVKVYKPDGSLVQTVDGLVREHRFNAGLDTKLEPGQVVIGYLVRDGNEAAPSAPVVVPGGAAPDTGKPKPAAEACPEKSDAEFGDATIGDLREGDTAISGKSPFGKGSVAICVNGTRRALENPADPDVPQMVNFTGGKYAVKLKQAVTAGQSVRVVVTNAAGKQAVKETTVAAALSSACPTESNSDEIGPPTIDPLKAGTSTVSGGSALTSGKVGICIGGDWQDVENPADPKQPQWANFTGGKYSVKLKTAKIEAGRAVRVVITDGKDLQLTAQGTAKRTCIDTPIRFLRQPQEGQTTLYGVGSASDDAVKCSVSVYVNGDEAVLVNSSGNQARSVDTGPDASFSVQLKDSLDSGQCVVLMQYEQNHPPPYVAQEDVRCVDAIRGRTVQSQRRPGWAPPLTGSGAASLNASPTYTVSPGLLVISYLNLGRMRSYFAGGMVLSQDDGDFTHTNSFLAFNVDKNWRWGGPSCPPPYRNLSTPGTFEEGPQCGDHPKYRRLMINSYFEARLTAVPVAALDCSGANTSLDACKKAAAATTTSTGNTPGGTKTTADTTTPSTPASAAPSALTTRQAATLTGGVYLPYAITTWFNRKDPYALTLGPIAKIGFQTPISAAQVNGTLVTLNDRRFYVFHTYGGRIGVSRMSYSKDVAPELISYIDVTIGRFSNFDVNDGSGKMRRPWRFQLEGIMKVPGYPVVLGFQANVRQNFGTGDDIQFRDARDDLRFFIGTRFDAGKAIAKITGQ